MPVVESGTYVIVVCWKMPSSVGKQTKCVVNNFRHGCHKIIESTSTPSSLDNFKLQICIIITCSPRHSCHFWNDSLTKIESS